MPTDTPYGNTTPVAAVSYRDIQDKYNDLVAQGHPLVSKMSLHDYATALNQQTNSHAYDAGLNPNVVKDASASVDRALDQTGVTDLTGGIGQALGGLVSPQGAALGEQFGRGIVRPVVAGLIGAGVGTLLAPGAGTAAGAVEGAEAGGAGELAAAAWKLFGSNVGYGTNQAVQTYTDTDSIPAAAASGALGYFTHGFGAAGEAAAARLVGTKIGSTLAENGIRVSDEGVIPTLAEMATEKFGLTAGYAVNNEVTRQAVNLAMGRGLSLPTTEEAVSEVAQAGAPLILGAAHDVMGIGEAQQPGRDARSMSESINLVRAAQKISTDEIRKDVERTALAAETTIAKTQEADLQRAGAIATVDTGTDYSSRVLSPEDAAKSKASDEAEKTQHTTALGKPLVDYGVDSELQRMDAESGGQPQSVPANKPLQEDEQKQPTQAASETNSSTESKSTPETTAESSKPVESPVQSGGVEQHTEQPVPAVVQPVVERIPTPPTLESVINRVRMLNRTGNVPTMDNFQELVHLHTEVLKQLADHPELRNSINIDPFSNEYFGAKLNHLLSPEGGSMKPVDALVQTLQSSKQHLAQKYKEFTTKLSELNNAKFEATERAKQLAVSQVDKPSSKDFLLEVVHGPFGEEIREALDTDKDMPMNTALAVERWVRQTRLNQDENARSMLREITDQQKALGRKLTSEQLDFMLKEKEAGLSHEAVEDIRDLFSRNGALWTRNGEISTKGKLHLLLTDSGDEGHGAWSMTLKQYLRATAGREKTGKDGTVSLDKSHGEDGGESTIAHTDLAGESDKLARERHSDPIAVEVAKKQSDERVAQTKDIRTRLYNMDTDRKGLLSQICRAAGMAVPDNLDRFKRLLCTYADGVSLTPSERTLEALPKNTGGLDAWLMHGEDGSHSAWQQVGDSNIPKWKKLCKQFYNEFVEFGPDGVPRINPKYAEGAKPGEPEDVRAKVIAGLDTSDWTDKEKAAGSVMQDRNRPNQLALSARSWFTDYLRASGVDDKHPMFQRYLDSMTRVALLFPQIDRARVGGVVARVGDVKGDLVEGVAYSKWLLDDKGAFGSLRRFVGLANTKTSDVVSSVFLRNLTAAHEFNHVVFSAYRNGELSPGLSAKLDTAEEIAAKLSADERRQILNSIRQFALPKEITSGRAPEAQEVMAHTNSSIEYGVNGGLRPDGKDDPEEFLSVMFELLGVGLANPAESTKNLKNFEQLRQFIPDRLEQFRQAYYTDLLHYTNAIRGFFNEHTPGLGDKYTTIANAYQAAARPSPEVSRALASVHEMESKQPQNYLRLADEARAPDVMLKGIGTTSHSAISVADMSKIYGMDFHPDSIVRAKASLAFANKFLSPDVRLAPVYGEKPGFWSMFTPLAQFAERFPVLRPLADTLLGYDGMVNSANAIALAPFASTMKNGRLVRTENLESLKRLVGNPATRQLLNKLFLWANKNETVITAEHIAKFGPSLSPSQREDVLHAVDSVRQSMQTVAQGTINTSLHTSSHLLGSLAMGIDKGMTAKTGEQLGLNLMKALGGLRSQDPHVAQMSNELLGGVKMQLSPEAWVHVLQAGQELAQQHGDLTDKLLNRPWYTPETRPHEFGMYYEKEGKPVFTSFKTGEEAVAARDQLAKQPGVSGLRLINPYDRNAPGSQYSEAAVTHFVQLEQTAFRSAQQMFQGDPEKLAQFAQLYSPGAALIKELGSRGIRKNMQERKFIGGREDIDMLSNALNYVSASTRANAKNYIRSRTMLQGADPSLTNEPRLLKVFTEHMNNVLNPPSQANAQLKNLTMMYYIGGNLSSAAMQAFQPIQTTLPHLTRNGVGVVQGMQYYADACGTLFKAFAQGKGITNDPMLQRAYDKATAARTVGFSNVMAQFDHMDDAFVSRIKNFAEDSGDSAMTPTKLLQNTAYHTTRILSYMFQHVNDHNNRVSFIAGFNAARDQALAKGLKGQDVEDYAYGEATRTVQESQMIGGQAARPVGFGQLGGAAYGVAGNLYALNHFNFSMISIMARYGMEALGKTGLEGAALHNARRAFAQSMVTQLALGGALGLPFAGTAVAMLEQLFPNLELNKDMRSAIAGLAGDDHEMGGFLADASLKGLATAFSPVDVSGRMGLSAVTGNDPYYGFEASDVLGASGSMLLNMTKGVQQIASGDPTGATRFMPTFLQNLYKSASDGGDVKNAQGQTVFKPTDAQRVMQAIGLRPKEQSHLQEQAMIDSRDQTIQARQLSAWYQAQEAKLAAGDYAGVKAALYQKAQDDATFSPVVALKRIAAGVQKSQVVQSPIDKGSASQLQSREKVAQTFGQPTTSQSQPSQVQQLLQRTELERQVGLPGGAQIAKTELSQARLTDYLMQRYSLDEATAKSMVARLQQQHQTGYRQFHPGAANPLSALSASQPPSDVQTPGQ